MRLSALGVEDRRQGAPPRGSAPLSAPRPLPAPRSPASREGGSRGVHLWGSGSGRPGDAAVAAFKLGDWLSGHFGAERGAFLSWRLGRAESCGRVESAAQRTRTVSLLTAPGWRSRPRSPRAGTSPSLLSLPTGWGRRACPLASDGLGMPPLSPRFPRAGDAASSPLGSYRLGTPPPDPSAPPASGHLRPEPLHPPAGVARQLPPPDLP